MTELFDYRDGDVSCHGRIALPAGQNKAPAIAVFADLSGVSEQTIGRAERLASELGYIGLAADMYGHGRSVQSIEEGVPLVQSWLAEPERIVCRAGAALDALARHPRCDGRLAAIGFCFGGAVTLELARANYPGYLAGVSFHGNLATVRPGQARIGASLLVCHGAEDPFVGKAELVAFLDEMAICQADCQTIAYTGAAHSFTSPAVDALGMTGAFYHGRTDDRSWQAMGRHLREAFGN
ncbi:MULTISPECIES: dienelactone hydrolase family protein [unclassified Sphingomonas]|uniref:dienelactone hydrolase family protein n=1 Tax=unclassified Sphingomonas TaxID=196159 RepID=UPI0006FA4F87|nr:MULTISPECIES: dienelactone hydrolase family protein [unclassified Sphingomonas]KQX19240.1 dienelactone hydrolase [Sphingomonas sp. Root1294]KQY65442.1 dienelactone hydrolase [Sphingomonas sp. Root50]KRB95260.1 dienelactone hydrolase [Sphingomonas sp. Root720]